MQGSEQSELGNPERGVRVEENRPAELNWVLKKWLLRLWSRFEEKFRYVASDGVMLSR